MGGVAKITLTNVSGTILSNNITINGTVSILGDGGGTSFTPSPGDYTTDDITETATRVFLSPAEKGLIATAAPQATTYTKAEVDNIADAVINGIDRKEAVTSFADLATTYPTPDLGWTVAVNDEDAFYMYTAGGWINIANTTVPLASAILDGKMASADFIKLSKLVMGTGTVTGPNFAFNFNSYFDSSGGILFKSTTAQPASISTSGTYDEIMIKSGGYASGKYSGGINLVSSIVNFYDVNGVIYLKVEPTAAQTKIKTQYGSELYLDSSSGVVGFNGTIDLSNAGTYADNAAAAAGGVAVGSVYIETTTNNLKIRV